MVSGSTRTGAPHNAEGKRQEGMRFNPAPDEQMHPDDFLIAMGEPAQLRQLELTAGSPS